MLLNFLVINDNLQLVTLWLSADETTVLDNALITMDHLYRSGTVSFFLRHLLTRQSYYEINYTIDRIQHSTKNDQNAEQIIHSTKPEKMIFTLSLPEIEDHKRQLTFCNIDAQHNLFVKQLLADGQLKLLQKVDEIFEMFNKLELAGHPDYQLHEETFDMQLTLGSYYPSYSYQGHSTTFFLSRSDWLCSVGFTRLSH